MGLRCQTTPNKKAIESYGIPSLVSGARNLKIWISETYLGIEMSGAEACHVGYINDSAPPKLVRGPVPQGRGITQC